MKRFILNAAVVIGVLIAAPAAGAVTIAVSTTDDTFGGSAATCSLREAVTAAQTDAAFDGCPAGSGADTVSLPSGEYRITRLGPSENANSVGDFDVLGTDTLSVRPAGPNAKVTLNGGGVDRVLDQQGNNSLSLTDIHVTGGSVAGEDGGGILNTVGDLTLENVTVSENQSSFSGGGVAVYGSLDMINSTIALNSSVQSGGGLYVTGGAAATVKSSTIAGNVADAMSADSGDGGGFSNTASTVSLLNTVFAYNEDRTPAPGTVASDCSSDPNFFPRFVLSQQPLGPVPCLVGFNPGTNLLTADPLLDPGLLADNGGQTPTVALLAGSPAIAAGGTSAPDQCPPTDQTGRSRPSGSCDIGAVQYVAPPAAKARVSVRKVLPKKKTVRRGKAIRVSVVVGNSGSAVASGVKVCLRLKGAARKAFKVRGKACGKVGSLKGGKTGRAKLDLVAKKKAKKKSYRIVAQVKGKNFPARSRSFRAKVR